MNIFSVLQTSLLFAKKEGLLGFLRKSLSNEMVRGVYSQILVMMLNHSDIIHM